jgi:asparagine synthetase B (glutamine-hydrolysing)
VPFLDVDFVAKAMSIPPERKMIHDRHHRREKAYLRQMFRSETRAIRALCWPSPSVCGVV